MKVYDKVWVMQADAPKQKIVFAVIESMNYSKNGTEVFYRLVDNVVGTGWGNHEGIRYPSEKVFGTKEELVNSL